jgi:hypothetical protein
MALSFLGDRLLSASGRLLGRIVLGRGSGSVQMRRLR